MIVKVFTVLVFVDSFPPSQERCDWIILVGNYVSVNKFDVNDGFSLLIP